MKEIFVDTSAFYAFADSRDPYYRLARRFFQENRMPLVSTNFIFAETLSLVTKRLGKKTAIKFGYGFKSSHLIRMIYVSVEHQEKAWRIFSQAKDKDYDYIDCICFVCMDAQGIGEAFTFDKHFRQKGYKMLPAMEEIK